jgi:hypothetical protein
MELRCGLQLAPYRELCNFRARARLKVFTDE